MRADNYKCGSYGVGDQKFIVPAQFYFYHERINGIIYQLTDQAPYYGFIRVAEFYADKIDYDKRDEYPHKAPYPEFFYIQYPVFIRIMDNKARDDKERDNGCGAIKSIV